MAERAEKETTLVAGFVDANAAPHSFASLFYAEYQPASHILKYVNAAIIRRLCFVEISIGGRSFL